MAVPTGKKSKSKMGTRRSHDSIKAASLGVCPNCQEAKMPHRVCPKCGYYNGREVLQVEE